MYRDLGRAAVGGQRIVLNDHSSTRPAIVLPSQSSDSTDSSAISKNKNGKHKSYYSSCRDMMRSLSYHVDHLFMELEKSMLLSSRQESNHVTVPASIISVVTSVTSVILDHLKFGGHVNPSDMEVFISTKCRYLGKVMVFIDWILLDRPEFCNPITVNCFYSQGVIRCILTTFEATSQLLFTINRVPASPMETDNMCLRQVEMEENDSSRIYGPLTSCCAVMDHLVTSSFIFTSSTKQFLEQALTSGSSPLPQDAEAFVKILQWKVLKMILQIWAHPHFAECNSEFSSALFSIMRHIFSGVEIKNVSGSNRARTLVPLLDETSISMIVEMRFSRSRAEDALRQVGANSIELATD